jgi:hypothetical protein
VPGFQGVENEERKTKMVNHSDALAAISSATVKAQRARPIIGEHIYEVLETGFSEHKESSSKWAETKLEVVESTTDSVGRELECNFQVIRTARYKGDTGDGDLLLAFVAALTDTSDADKVKELAGYMYLGDGVAEQAAKGMLVRCIVAQALDKDKKPKVSAKGFPILNYTWFHVKQTEEEIQARRAKQIAAATPAPAAKTSLLGSLGK